MRRSALFLVGTAVAALASPSFAQTEPEATAQAVNQPDGRRKSDEDHRHRDEARHDASRTCRSRSTRRPKQDIQRSNALTLEDVSRNIAGLAVQNLGPGQSQVSIRGVSAGQIVRDQPGVKEQVGVYLDETVISLSLFTPDLDLFDLNRVETLRGPQGTLFGSGYIGGTIRYITNQPKLGASPKARSKPTSTRSTTATSAAT